jgi:hypothetical protein
MFCICSVVLGIFIFVCTSVGLLPPGESPIAVNNNNNNNNNNKVTFIGVENNVKNTSSFERKFILGHGFLMHIKKNVSTIFLFIL